MLQLIEADIRFDSDSRSRIAKVGVIARDDSKTLAFRLPRKVGHRVYEKISVKNMHYDQIIYLSVRPPLLDSLFLAL